MYGEPNYSTTDSKNVLVMTYFLVGQVNGQGNSMLLRQEDTKYHKNRQRETKRSRGTACSQRLKAEALTGIKMKIGSVTGKRAKGKCWRVLHEDEEQSSKGRRGHWSF